MSIILYLGNIGSGKSAYAVREMFNNPHRTYYSNITVRKLKNSVALRPEMLFTKSISYGVRGKANTDYKLNVDYWKNAKKPISVIIDEAHSVLNSRRAMGKQSILLTEWLSLLRRVLGSSGSDYGDLILISQQSRRLDIIARSMAHKIYQFCCHYRKRCSSCGMSWPENSDMPEQLMSCPRCNSSEVIKFSHILEVKVFAGLPDYELWQDMGLKTFFRNFLVKDIEKVFPLYDTLQWENFLSQDYG